jgi:hypothetical protein
MAVMELYDFISMFGRPAYTAFLLKSKETGAAGLNQLLVAKLQCSYTQIKPKRKLADIDDEYVVDLNQFLIGGEQKYVVSTDCFECSQALLL